MSASDSEKKQMRLNLRAKRDQEVLRLTRQSGKLVNRPRLRRANTKTGIPKAPDWTTEEEALLGKMPEQMLQDHGDACA